jgi:intracellular sulfur oxidation DsrE/DsrF family protein
MQRRTLFKTLAASALASLAARAAAAEETRATRVVYHLSSADKAGFVLGCMKNHRAGGPDGLKLAAVAHGPALGMFRDRTDNEALRREFAARIEAGDAFYACANTLAAHQWTLADLLPGFALAEKGGVVKLADLQAQGWIYLRP